MKFNPLQTFELYNALSLHFTESSSYDFFKYSGKLRVSNKQYNRFQKHESYFHLLSKKVELRDFLVSNFFKYGRVWVGDLVTEDKFDETYRKWDGYRSSFFYHFKNELNFIGDNFCKSLRQPDDYYSRLFELYLNKKVSADSLLLIDSITGCLDKWNETIDSEDIIWNNEKFKLDAYRPFVNIKRKKPEIIKILLDKYRRI